MKAVKRTGPWSPAQSERFLAEARIPIRLACNGASGTPLLASLWFVFERDRLWCATQRSASLAQQLRRDPRCAFEVAGDQPPYFGVRGQGIATFHDDRAEEVLRTLIARYPVDPDSELASWLLARVESETAIAIEPRTLVSWDYRNRMAPAR